MNRAFPLRWTVSVRQFILLFFLAISSIALNAQVKGTKTSLELGSVTVWLGMPRQEVVKRCGSAGYSMANRPGDDLEIRDSEKLTTPPTIACATALALIILFTLLIPPCPLSGPPCIPLILKVLSNLGWERLRKALRTVSKPLRNPPKSCRNRPMLL